MNDRTKAFLAIFFGALLGGAVTTVTKIGLINFPPLTFAFLRFLIASVVILPLFIKKYKFSIRQLRDLMPFTLFATLNIILFIFGIKSTTATIGQLLYAGTPFLTGLMLYILFGEKLSIKKLRDYHWIYWCCCSDFTSAFRKRGTFFGRLNR